MRKPVAVVSIVPVLLSLVLLAAPANGEAPDTAHSRGGTFSMLDRFAREGVRKGDADTGSYFPSIEHVRELQYRLRWAGVFYRPATGYFGGLTEAAVERFQRQNHLRVTGVADHATWEKLIPRTLLRRGAIPSMCRGMGWNLCYDRSRHQVTLWHAGNLWNSWLVRGGGRGHETRVGEFKVYRRDKDHVSGLFGTPMPYSQFFSGGQAFHGSPFMVDPFVDHSHGCVNMYIEDARQLWKRTKGKHVDVAVYGAWD